MLLPVKAGPIGHTNSFRTTVAALTLQGEVQSQILLNCDGRGPIQSKNSTVIPPEIGGIQKQTFLGMISEENYDEDWTI
jgi:hypothetical protein